METATRKTMTTPPKSPSYADIFTPKLISCFREGYTLQTLRADAIAGLTVAIVALPLSMAIAIASGVPPERGLFTAIVGGLLISALGGSRFQIGGPTAAFIVVVFNVVQRHGYDGLALATLMAGLLLVIIGALRLGTYIKYIPYPVVTGFTSGIAVSILASQFKDIMGLDVSLPGDFLPKMMLLVQHAGETVPAAVLVTVLALGIIIGTKRFRPHWPGFLIAVVVASAVTYLLDLHVATIASRFGGVPRTLPSPAMPAFDLNLVKELLPDAITIALLAGIESLLSAVVADGMTGRRHRSNCELVAQGVANCASVFFGGISATGAIARTATNIRSGGRTPVAGILHAVFLLLFMAVAAPLLGYIPLAALAAILVMVAWNISEIRHIRHILGRATMGDRFVLVSTFLLTVFVDLTVAIEFGVVAAAILFVHRMAEAVEVETHEHLIDEDEADILNRPDATTPGDVVVYTISGPFFFGAAQRLSSILDRIGDTPKRYILDMSTVPFVDATGGSALSSFFDTAHGRNAEVVIVGARDHVIRDIRHLTHESALQPHFMASREEALKL
ncbi:Dicarboxylic acid uptake system A [Hartmannibacter diazotrophicus]|uniref:Dicarboxylic acid uptake system A n=2 Tax=Hartmannibacter diazotrophicus TaxID=1482074 RepID=A0A2C9D8M5_9HYPH|nr:Dicarboxylic acid uptake system A [Hartmannibacter diazotrophicus]